MQLSREIGGYLLVSMGRGNCDYEDMNIMTYKQNKTYSELRKGMKGFSIEVGRGKITRIIDLKV